MLRPRGGWLAGVAALLCAGCLVANPTSNPPAAALITATAPHTPTAAPATSTAITIVTGTAVVTVVFTDTVISPLPPASSSPLPSATPLPSLASSTPFATESTTPAPGATLAPAPTSPPTVPPQASAPAVGIASFSISPQTINPGETITLTWQATGDQAAIYRLEPAGPLTDMRSVPLTGTLAIQVSSALRNRVDYVLYASAGGSTASAQVSAIIRCPDPYFFANPPAGCPSVPGPLRPMAAERLEHGLMIWDSSSRQIYVLFGDGASPQWETLPDTWVPGQPESDPNLTPPAGLFQPVRGFGLVWRANDPGSGQTVRGRLGWATEPEAALTGAVQCDSAPKYSQCFISGPGGAVYQLLPEFSGWKLWQGL